MSESAQVSGMLSPGPRAPEPATTSVAAKAAMRQAARPDPTMTLAVVGGVAVALMALLAKLAVDPDAEAIKAGRLTVLELQRAERVRRLHADLGPAMLAVVEQMRARASTPGFDPVREAATCRRQAQVIETMISRHDSLQLALERELQPGHRRLIEELPERAQLARWRAALLDLANVIEGAPTRAGALETLAVFAERWPALIGPR